MSITFSGSGGSSAASKRQVTVTGSLNALVAGTAHQDFRRESGAPTSTNPFVASFNAQITQIVLSNRMPQIWAVRLLINDNPIIVPYIKLAATPVEILNLGTSGEIINEGDFIRLRFLGGTGAVDNPSVSLTYTEL